MIKSWTVDEMLAEKPCSIYTRDRLAALMAGRESITLLDVLDLDIPDADKVWVACRPNAFDRQAEWIEGIVERTVRKYALTCEATREWAEKWLSGEDCSAESAAWAAARAAEAAAARAAEAAAARAAEAAWAAARAAEEYTQQLADLRALLLLDDSAEETNDDKG